MALIGLKKEYWKKHNLFTQPFGELDNETVKNYGFKNIKEWLASNSMFERSNESKHDEFMELYGDQIF